MPGSVRRKKRKKTAAQTQARPKGRAAARNAANRVIPARPPARFCVRCGTRMRSMREHGVMRPTCPACGFIAYRNPAPACGVLLLHGNRILLARRGHEPRKNAWGIPAGFMEYGEHPETTATREALEETGLRVRLTGLFGVYAGRDDPRTRAVLILYHGKAVAGRLRPGDDAIELGYFPLDRLPRPIAFRAHREALRDLWKSLGRAAGKSERSASPAARRRASPAARRRANRNDKER